jgi:hypothetical protein
MWIEEGNSMSKPNKHLYDPPADTMRAVLFRDRPPLPAPRPGPLEDKRVMVVVAPTGASGRDVRVLGDRLSRLGAVVGIASECHGEARDEHMRPIYTHCLLIEIQPDDWDLLVFAGGQGALRVAEDQLAHSIARSFLAAGKPVAAIGQGAAILRAARVAGSCFDNVVDLAERLEPGAWSPEPGEPEATVS